MSATKKPNVSHVMREMILQCDTLDKTPAKKLLAMARARIAQMGGNPNVVKDFSVVDTKYKLRVMLGSNPMR